MQISFNGIKNLHIGKKEYELYGSYVTPDSFVKQGNKNITEVKISCNLTDDSDGNDLSEFRKALQKSGEYYQINCINKHEPDKLELRLFRQDIKDSRDKITNSEFRINGRHILLKDKAQLPLFTYMAHLTRKIAGQPNVSQAQKYYSNLVNQSVADEAVKFIETY